MTQQTPQLPGMAYLPYLRAWRVYRRYKVRELAKEAGVGPSAISEFEGGKRQATALTIDKLARALKIKPTMLVFVNPEDLPEDGRGAA